MKMPKKLSKKNYQKLKSEKNCRGRTTESEEQNGKHSLPFERYERNEPGKQFSDVTSC
jgi:hypothetical protein